MDSHFGENKDEVLYNFHKESQEIINAIFDMADKNDWHHLTLYQACDSICKSIRDSFGSDKEAKRKFDEATK